MRRMRFLTIAVLALVLAQQATARIGGESVISAREVVDSAESGDASTSLKSFDPARDFTAIGVGRPEFSAEEAPFRPSRFGVDAFIETDSAPLGNSALSLPKNTVYIQNWVQLDYLPAPNTVLYFRPTWNTVMASPDSKATLNTTPGKSVTKIGDTILGITQKKMLTWGEGGSLTGFGRFYLPTAEQDRTTGQVGEFFFRGNAEQPLNSRVTLWFDTKIWWAIQSRDAYADPYNNWQASATFDKEVNPYGTIILSLNKHFRIYQSLGLDYVWMRGKHEAGAIAPQEYTMTYFDTALGTNIVPHVDMRLGFNDEPTMNVSAPPKFFAPTEFYSYFWMIVSI